MKCTEKLLLGLLLVFLQSFICAPIELVKLRTQHQKVGTSLAYPGNWTTLKGIYHTKGVAGCFQGLGVTIFRDTPAFAAYFVSYAAMMRKTAELKEVERNELSMGYSFTYGGIAGMVSWTVNYPVDVVKTRIQMDGNEGARRVYSSSWDCFVKIWREGGVRLLYRGLMACYTRAFFNSAFLFTAVEFSEKVFRENI